MLYRAHVVESAGGDFYLWAETCISVWVIVWLVLVGVFFFSDLIENATCDMNQCGHDAFDVWKSSYGNDYPVVCVSSVHPFMCDIILIKCKKFFFPVHIFSTYSNFFFTFLSGNCLSSILSPCCFKGNFWDWFRLLVCCINLRSCSRCYWFVQHRGVILSCWRVRVWYVFSSFVAVWLEIDQSQLNTLWLLKTKCCYCWLLEKWKGRVHAHILQFVSCLLTNRSQFSSHTPMWQ